MARELLSIQIGQAGIQTGKQVWDLLRIEHGLDEEGLQKKEIDGNLLSAVFHECQDDSYSARSVFIDSEANIIDDSILTSSMKNLFCKEYFVNGTDPAGNVYPRGRNDVSKKIHGNVTTAIRRSMEQCENINGFCSTSSVGGGTGSGYASQVFTYLADVAPKIPKMAHQYLCSSQIQSNLCEPYNNIFAITDQRKSIDIIFSYDNQTLYRLIEQAYGQDTSVNYKQINHLVALTQCGISSSSRFQEAEPSMAMDCHSMSTNLIPFPNLKNVTTAVLPLRAAASKIDATEYELTAEAFLHEHEMCSVSSLLEAKYFSCCLFYRGDVSVDKVSNACFAIRRNFQTPFVRWSPTGLKSATSTKKMQHGEFSHVFQAPHRALFKLSNHTGISDFLMNILQKFSAMYDRKDFVAWFCSEGMEEGQFVDAQENLEAYLKSARATMADGGDEEEKE